MDERPRPDGSFTLHDRLHDEEEDREAKAGDVPTKGGLAETWVDGVDDDERTTVSRHAFCEFADDEVLQEFRDFVSAWLSKQYVSEGEMEEG